MDKFNKNYELKVSLVNIDSRFRNKNPINSTEDNLVLLENNPIILEENSKVIKINYKNNNTFSIGDSIILRDIVGESIKINNPLYFHNGLNYLFIRYPNHLIPQNF